MVMLCQGAASGPSLEALWTMGRSLAKARRKIVGGPASDEPRGAVAPVRMIPTVLDLKVLDQIIKAPGENQLLGLPKGIKSRNMLIHQATDVTVDWA